MFPVTRQVRRKRTPVFGRPGRTRGSAGGSEESGGACAQRVGSGEKQRVGSGEKRRGLGEKQGWARGERKAGLGGHEVPGQANASLAPGRSGRPIRGSAGPLSGGSHPPDPLGRDEPLGGATPQPPGNQRCDPAGPAAVVEMPGPIRWDTAPSWSPHNRELRRARATSARPRTPRRCWREYARAH
jgi:hypothetical protein